MQTIANAIIALGRSLADIRANLWLCGALATEDNPSHGPKCANGLLTMHLGHVRRERYDGRRYEWNYGYLNELMDNTSREAARRAAVALVKAAQQHDPTLIYEADSKTGDPGVREALAAPETADLDSLAGAIAMINDVGYDEDQYGDGGSTEAGMGPDGAARWFSDAIDILAQELPDPLPVLTVEEILAAPVCTGHVDETHGLQHDGDTCPIHEHA